jgi:hypothetical protein
MTALELAEIKAPNDLQWTSGLRWTVQNCGIPDLYPEKSTGSLPSSAVELP